MKKVFSISLIVVMLSLGLASGTISAETDTDCSSYRQICYGVYLESGDLSADTNTISVPSGATIAFGGNNHFLTKGKFQVEVILYRVDTFMEYDSMIIPYGQSDSDWAFNVPAGDYVVIVKSGDYSQGRSYAYGYISYSY